MKRLVISTLVMLAFPMAQAANADVNVSVQVPVTGLLGGGLPSAGGVLAPVTGLVGGLLAPVRPILTPVTNTLGLTALLAPVIGLLGVPALH